jgi:hypothetical protein
VPEDIVEKVLIVTSVSSVTEAATGNYAYQVTFGYYIKNTPEVLSRMVIPDNMRAAYNSNYVLINEIVLLLKAEEVPYKVGSKWKMKIHKNGTFNLVKSE